MPDDTRTPVTPEVIELVATLANQLVLHDNPASSFYKFLPGILASSLFMHVADYGRRYDTQEMDAILELAKPHIALKGSIIEDLRRDWIMLSVYGDVMRGSVRPEFIRLINAFLSRGPVREEIVQIFKEKGLHAPSE